jgi:hypothetical protein
LPKVRYHYGPHIRDIRRNPQELARQYAPTAIVELARLALKAKSETARIAAIRELLDRGYGRSRQAMEISAPAGDPIKLFDELDALSRKGSRYTQEPKDPRKSISIDKTATAGWPPVSPR